MKNDLLRHARKERGWTQEQLAEKLEVAVRTVRSWEGGDNSPILQTRSRLCDLFGMTAAQLGLAEDETGQQLPQETQTVSSQISASPQSGAPVVHDVSKPVEHDPNHQRMLKRVRSRWISGFLDRSLAQGNLIHLHLREQPDAVVNPWADAMQASDLLPRVLPEETRIVDIYDETDGSLLILGEPGAGKTTSLLSLSRELLNRATCHANHPIPVVFNLSAWAQRRQTLTEWLIDELNTKYQIPRKLGELWVTTDQVLPLLDGLDEVGPSFLNACIEGINNYRQEHGMVPLVICSRASEYLTQPSRLRLDTAIVVQPLTPQQIDWYIKKGGSDLTALQQVLQQDVSLREMASTPLMLNTLMIAYQGLPQNEIPTKSPPQIQRTVVFATYIERMLQRRTPKKTYATALLKQYLGWLARQMLMRNQTEFYVERLQPEWLEKSRESYKRTVIRLITATQCLTVGALGAWLKGGLKNGVVGSGNGILGLFGGGPGNSMLGWMAPGIGGGNQGGASLIIMLGIVIWLISIVVGSPTLPTITLRTTWHGLRVGVRAGLFAAALTACFAIPFFILGLHDFQRGLGVPIFIGMFVGLLRGLWTAVRQDSQDKTSFSHQFMDGLFFAGAGGFSFMVISLMLQVNYTSTLIYSCIAGFFCLILYGFGGGSRLFPSLGEHIQPAEIVTWSWKQVTQDMVSNSKKSLLIALTTLVSVSTVIGGVSSLFFFNIGYGLRYGLVFGCISSLIVGMAGIFTSMLKSGWNSDILPKDQRTTPNEGIKRSGRNALISACVFAPLGGIGSGLACGLGFGIVGGLSTWLVMGMAFALMLALVFFVILTIGHGGIAWIEHYTLRVYLWRAKHLPLNSVRFLDTASEYGLVRKVGGGYMFTHRLLLEYFAHVNKSKALKDE